MKKKPILAACVGLVTCFTGVKLMTYEAGAAPQHPKERSVHRPIRYEPFPVDVLVNGRTLDEHHARGKTYIEAQEGAEYEVRIRNPMPYRVAVALSVDGLNSIDAKRTTAWGASKWVIEPYATIYVSGWQMSSSRARRFYFTTERDSYAAKLGQTANLGVISAVFFRERQAPPIVITPAPPTRSSKEGPRNESAPPAGREMQADSSKSRSGMIAPVPDDESAATGIGRSVPNAVRWVHLHLDSNAVGEVTLRYEYYPALVKLGVYPRHYPQDSLRRREGSTGFEFSPEP